ncbi:MAG: PEP-CTERM sorting domain-containing protein [Phycisphaeraceae bacterium]|nr:PEP-CTERM sorting domain-containing protein [Phycisphaeraceae bacterium]
MSPVARWHNPAGDGSPISITGRVRFNMDAAQSEAGLELVVAVADRWGNVRPLYNQSLSAEEVSENAHRGIVVPIELRNIIVNQGDSIIITARVDDVGASGDEPVVVDLMDDVSIVMQGHQGTEDLHAFAGHRKVPGLFSGSGRRGGGGGGGGGTPYIPPEPPEMPPPPDMPPPDVPNTPPVIPAPGTLMLVLTAAGCTLTRRRRA